jgi:ribosomal protein L11 methyltransferase
MNYQPFDIGRKFRVVPPGCAPSRDRINLVMQRGAFGSGEHQTTMSCIELMEGLVELEAARVLDLGSGTGILAIAALKLGARAAVCVDIEARAVETARNNCTLNDIEGRITHITGTLDNVGETGFDVILANIYGDILIELSGPLSGKLKQGGVLLLSGILWEYNFDVRQAYERQGCIVIKNRLLDEFSTILMKKS